jgi:N6-L-threonylcarbamoyladenine synthase
MIVLGIESSCDETAVAVVRDGTVVLSSVVATQIAKHAPFGGVIPELAAREHLSAIGPLFDAAIKQAGISIDQIDAIGVTQGPGLIGPLLVGASFARAFALANKIPIVPVDHVHAHLFSTFLDKDPESMPRFPALAMVVSGGHTNVYRMESWIEFRLLGFSLDDACGECFDKVGKMLGLPYPGGPHIESKAVEGDDHAFQMPSLNLPRQDMRFSFSGLKTHMLNLIRSQHGKMNDQIVSNICASFQRAAFKQILARIDGEWKARGDYQSLIVAGGVAANQYFRRTILESINSPVLFPDRQYCGDNAAMVASYAYFTCRDRLADFSGGGNFWEPYSTYPYEALQ